MNARHLEVFRAVMRHGSLTAAAEALHVSQPAVSKVLRHFESVIGYQLFERISGRLIATAEAHLLFQDADRIFREIEALKVFSNRIRDKQLSLLRVAASAPPTFALLPIAALRFRRRNPGARLVLQTLPAQEIAERILIGDADLGLTMTTLSEPQIRNDVVGSAEIVALMPRTSPLAGKDFVTPADLAGETLISYGRADGDARLSGAWPSLRSADRDKPFDRVRTFGGKGAGRGACGRADPVGELRGVGGPPFPTAFGARDRARVQHDAAAITFLPGILPRHSGGDTGPGKRQARRTRHAGSDCRAVKTKPVRQGLMRLAVGVDHPRVWLANA
jgi:DNA-binding transcriptional LysR family regulator